MLWHTFLVMMQFLDISLSLTSRYINHSKCAVRKRRRSPDSRTYPSCIPDRTTLKLIVRFYSNFTKCDIKHTSLRTVVFQTCTILQKSFVRTKKFIADAKSSLFRTKSTNMENSNNVVSTWNNYNSVALIDYRKNISCDFYRHYVSFPRGPEKVFRFLDSNRNPTVMHTYFHWTSSNSVENEIYA